MPTATGTRAPTRTRLSSLGTAPLDAPLFRAALFEQLSESRLEPAVTTDIVGKDHAHAVRLDLESTPEIKESAIASEGRHSDSFRVEWRSARGESTLPEVRLAVAEPGLDIGNVEQCLEALTDGCYYLAAEKNRYRFSFQPNLNKLLVDRRASVSAASIEQIVKREIQRVFGAGPLLSDEEQRGA